MEKKEKIGIVADEGGDLPREIVEKYKISIVPFKLDLGKLAQFPGNIYQKIREAEKRGLKIFVKTSQPSPGAFLKVFKEKLKKFEKIICFTLTSKHSGTFNSALQARSLLSEKERIHVIDTLSGSSGEGLVILKAASLIEKGLKLKEILERLKETVKRTNFIFMVKNPERLEATGRIPHFLALWLKTFQKMGISPLLGTKEGKIVLKGIKFVKKSIAQILFSEFKKKISNLKTEKIRVAITHGDAEKEAKNLKEKILKIKNTEVLFVNLIGKVLGAIAGPGALTLAWEYD